MCFYKFGHFRPFKASFERAKTRMQLDIAFIDVLAPEAAESWQV